MEYLSGKAQQALLLPEQDRIEYIRKDRWIGYSIAKDVIFRLEDLLNYPKRSRMPNLLVVGDTNNGKTSIVKQFRESHTPSLVADGAGLLCPVVYVQAPPTADESRLYTAILERFAAPYRVSDRIDKKLNQIINIMQRTQVQMLIIDEFHHVLAGSTNKQRQMLNAIKYIGNELMIPIVGVGTKDAFMALQADPQLSNRFEHAYLPKWDYNADYLSLLASFEYILPLKNASNLTNEATAKKILSLTDGVFGEISRLIVELGVLGIRNGSDKINISDSGKINWLPPYQRSHGLNA